TELVNLAAVQDLACERGWDLRAWQLACVVNGFQRLRSHSHEAIRMLQAGLAAARRLGDPDREALTLQYLGYAYSNVDQHGAAVRHLYRALDRYTRSGDEASQAHTHYVLALARGRQGCDEQALVHACQALRLFRALGCPLWTAWASNRVGWYHARL